MQIKKYDLQLETTVIITILHHNNDPETWAFFNRLSSEFFANPWILKIFDRIRDWQINGKGIPSLELLSVDPVLDDASRQFLLSDIKPVDTEKYDELYELLDHYRKLRLVLEYREFLDEHLQEPQWETIISQTQDILQDLHSATRKEEISSISSLDDIIQSLKVSRNSLLRTGFPHLDKEIGGFSRGDLVILVAPSSSGKSSLALQFALNYAKRGFSVGYLSLEMSKEAVWQRIFANLLGIPLQKIKEEPQVLEENRNTLEEIVSSIPSLDVIVPVTSVTPAWIETIIKAKQYDVFIVDYIRLLESNTRRYDSESHRLGQISRALKVIATNTGSILIVPAQANEEGLVKYARAIKEDCDVLLKWTVHPENRTTNQVEITIDKARNARADVEILFGFDFKLMRWWSLEIIEEEEEIPEESSLSHVLSSIPEDLTDFV